MELVGRLVRVRDVELVGRRVRVRNMELVRETGES